MTFKEFLKESQTDEYIMQKLADADINSKIEGKTVYVDKDDMAKASKVLRSIGVTMSVKELK